MQIDELNNFFILLIYFEKFMVPFVIGPSVKPSVLKK